MRQRFLVLLTVMLLGALTHIRAADAFIVTIDNIIYECADSEATVIGMADKSATICDIPETITHDGSIYSVTAIGEGAFQANETITTVNIGNAVKSIDRWAFYECRRLSHVTIPESVTAIYQYAFASCSSLTEIHLPDNIQTIKSKAFQACSSLTELIIPDSLGEIEDNTFRTCLNLKKVIIGNSVKSIGDEAFYNCNNLTEIRFPDSVTSIGELAFSLCSSLSEIYFGNSMESIGMFAFQYCRKLSVVDIPSIEAWLKIKFQSTDANPLFYSHSLSINGETVSHLYIPEGITTINAYCFMACNSLVSVTMPTSLILHGGRIFTDCNNLRTITFPTLKDYLKQRYPAETFRYTYGNTAKIFIGEEPLPQSIDWPEELTAIPDYTFYADSNLKSVNIPNTVTMIGQSAFNSCGNLRSVTLPNSVMSISSQAFANSGITEIVMPSYMTSIGEEAFACCGYLKEIAIPNDIQSIASKAFANCSSLTDVTIPASVTSIAYEAFAFCENLKEIVIPDNVSEIGRRAFYGCARLTNVELHQTLKNIKSEAFGACESLRNVDIPDILTWSRVIFTDMLSNPIYYASSFRIRDSEKPVNHLVIDRPYEAIRPYAFSNADNLQTVRIDVFRIGQQCFYGCDNLTDLCLNVEQIDSEAFNSNTSLRNIYSMTEVPPVALHDTFSNYREAVLYVPIGCAAAYANSPYCWRNFSDIRECDFSEIDSIFTADHEPMNAVRNITYDATLLNLTVADGVISAEADPDTLITIHNMQGACIHSGKGSVAVAVVPGIYIVTAGGRSQKIAVR